MGRVTAEVRIVAALSAHNSDRDAVDRELWQRLVAEVRAVVERAEFADLAVFVTEVGE